LFRVCDVCGKKFDWSLMSEHVKYFKHVWYENNKKITMQRAKKWRKTPEGRVFGLEQCRRYKKKNS